MKSMTKLRHTSGENKMTNKNTAETEGVEMEFIGGDRFDQMSTLDKVSMIINHVSDGKVVVLEKGLSPDEEAELIESTMSRIEPDEFTGLEIEQQQYSQSHNSNSLLDTLLNRSDDYPMTVIGPDGQLEAVDNNDLSLNAIVHSQN